MRDDDDTRERHRTTTEEAREQGTGKPEGGVEPAVPSYAEPGGTSDLGVDEPVVPPAKRGDPPPDESDDRN